MSTISGTDWTRPPLSSRDFDRFCKLAFDYCGLHIETGKEELVASRLGKIMRRLGLSSYAAYYDHVTGDTTSLALVEMIDNLTTNHTSFFREMQHFEFLKSTVFPALASRSMLAIWSAASSTGEEPYSLAFAAHQFFEGAGPQIRIWRRTSPLVSLKRHRRVSTKRAASKAFPVRYFIATSCEARATLPDCTG